MKNRYACSLLGGIVLAWGLSAPTFGSVYVNRDNEFIVTNTTAFEAGAKISGLNVTWASQVPPYGRTDIYYRTLPAGASTNITQDALHSQTSDIRNGVHNWWWDEKRF